MREESDKDTSTLCLTLKQGESVRIGDDIEVICKGRKPGTSSFVVCFRAPRSTLILRQKESRKDNSEAED